MTHDNDAGAGADPDRASSDRTIDLAIEVTGTPEEVWSAIATSRGISAWLHPTVVGEEPGGRFAFDLGDGMNESGRVAVWDPPHRFVTEGVEWAPGGDTPPARLATEWTIEARSGETCVVRMVMSGFDDGDTWDDEINGMTTGMREALESLRDHLSGSS